MSDNRPPFANPTPSGEAVLAFYLACLWPVATGMAPHSAGMILVALGFCGAIVQTIAGIMNMRNGIVLTGNIFLTFSAFMWYGCLEHLLIALKIVQGSTAVVDGIVFGVMALLMLGWTPCFMLKNTVGSLFMIVTDVFFVFASLYFLTGTKLFWAIAGWDLPLVIIACVWQVVGSVVNEIFGREVYWMGKPWITKKPVPASSQQVSLAAK